MLQEIYRHAREIFLSDEFPLNFLLVTLESTLSVLYISKPRIFVDVKRTKHMYAFLFAFPRRLYISNWSQTYPQMPFSQHSEDSLGAEASRRQCILTMAAILPEQPESCKKFTNGGIDHIQK